MEIISPPADTLSLPTAVSPRPRYLYLKRAVEFLVCLLLLPPLLLLFLVIAAAIRLDSPGAPIFIQDRVGLNGRRFRIYKFRTMRRDHNSQEHREFMQAFIAGQVVRSNAKAAGFKPQMEEQITRVGRLLRKTSLDELPQIINILKGEMSLIGPRPNVPWEVEAYQSWHHERLRVLPGVTGLAQVNGRSNITFDEMVTYDIQYARNMSAVLDLWILWKTVMIIFNGEGAG